MANVFRTSRFCKRRGWLRRINIGKEEKGIGCCLNGIVVLPLLQELMILPYETGQHQLIIPLAESFAVQK